MAAYLFRLIVSHMKKFLLLFIVILLAVEFRDHPALKPYADKITGMVTSEAKKTAGVSEFPALIKELERLEDSLSLHEFRFIQQELTSFDKAREFQRKQCQDTELAHSALTSYAIKKVCSVLEGHLPTAN